MKKLALFLALLIVLALMVMGQEQKPNPEQKYTCLLYTSDAADE